jgi:2-aminoadipate transaminase
MDYSALYSRMGQVGNSQGVVGVARTPPAAISFAFGLPDPGSFPVDELRDATERVLGGHSAVALQYGGSQGEPRLRQYVADRLNEHEGLSLTADNLQITSGSMQAITMLAQLLIDPDDTVLIEAPTFMGTVKMFQLFGARFQELPLDEHGLIVDELERRLLALAVAGVRAKFVYVIPTFHNPTGVTLPLERRLELLRVAREHELLVVEDDPYGDLRFEGAAVPSLQALDRDGLVVRLGSFSKILAAGLRLGWAAGPLEIIRGLSSVKLDSGTSPYAANLAAEWAEQGKLEPHVRKLIDIYRARRDAMLAGLEQHCGSYCTWTRPEGGFFIWVELNEGIDPDRLRQIALEAGVAYLPGPQCFSNGQGQRNLRLAFSQQTVENITDGIRRLGQAMAQAARQPVVS